MLAMGQATQGNRVRGKSAEQGGACRLAGAASIPHTPSLVTADTVLTFKLWSEPKLSLPNVSPLSSPSSPFSLLPYFLPSFSPSLPLFHLIFPLPSIFFLPCSLLSPTFPLFDQLKGGEGLHEVTRVHHLLLFGAAPLEDAELTSEYKLHQDNPQQLPPTLRYDVSPEYLLDALGIDE